MTTFIVCLTSVFLQTAGNPMEGTILTIDSLSMNGTHWHITGERTYSGSMYDQYPFSKQPLTAEQKEAAFVSEYPLPVSNLDTLYHHVNSRMHSATTGYALDVSEYGTSDDGHLYIPVNALYAYPSPCIQDEGWFEIIREQALFEKNITVIKIPDGYEIKSLPAIKEIYEKEYGRLSIRFEFLDRSIKITRTLELPVAAIEAEGSSELCLFYDLLTIADHGKIVLRRLE